MENARLLFMSERQAIQMKDERVFSKRLIFEELRHEILENGVYSLFQITQCRIQEEAKKLQDELLEKYVLENHPWNNNLIRCNSEFFELSLLFLHIDRNKTIAMGHVRIYSNLQQFI